MERRLFLYAVLGLVVVFALLPGSAHADGIIICDPPGSCPDPFPLPPLAIKYHHVTVTIDDQVALTHVDQVFLNPNDFQVEGTYIFPLPGDAVVTNFILWIDGQPVEGEVLQAAEARWVYEEIVRQVRDPALLEYVGRGLFQASIFPIPPGGERRIELEYSQVLMAENGLVRYTYPLNTEKFSTLPLENVSLSVEINSSDEPIRAVYSPSHDIAVNQENSHHVQAGYEEGNITPNSDFTLYYSLGESEAFHLLSFRDPDDPLDPDGFFLVLLAPQPEVDVEAAAKDIILVLDCSGSMEGEKFLQAQDALRYILSHLHAKDSFNIIAFNTTIEMYAHDMRPAGEADEAIGWVDRLYALGSTDINRALLEAASMTESEHPTYMIFLTDGLPTEGVTEAQEILDNLQEAAPEDLRLFTFGVGFDVDTFLLDSLSASRHGASSYVLPEEDLSEALSAFYARINTPVLTGLELDFQGVNVFDVYPSPLPDLFSGSQIVAAGRYHEGGTADVTLSGEVNGRPQTFSFPDQTFTTFSKTTSEESVIPRLWATRKIGHLLNQVRLEGASEETIDQIVHLSIRYGIVTPYTSYLVTEEAPVGQAEQERIANEAYQQLVYATPAPSFGAEAVQKASDQGNMAVAESVSSLPREVTDIVRVVGSHTYVLSAGTWVDTAFDPQTMEPVEVDFLSQDYFDLITASPDLGAAFALGSHVIAVSEGYAYEVIPEGIDPVSPDTSTNEISITPVDQASGSGGTIDLPCAGAWLPFLLPLVVVFKARRRN